MLDADIKLRLDRLSLDAAVTVGAGEVLALLGPNGAGKSTVLRALAGLLRLAGGWVALDGVVLEDPARRIHVAPEKRPVALMFQDYLLFPHLSAVENVAFGLRARGVDRRQARERARAALARLDVSAVASARPGAMSGGQQQRVAMARALVTEPGCCCSTSRWPRSTRRPRLTSGGSCARPCARRAPPTCWSPTTCWTRWRWPIGCSSSRTARSCKAGRRRRSPRAPGPATWPT